jgi:hypothetical protein
MRALSILLVVAGIGVGAATAYIAASRTPADPAPTPFAPANEFVSGPQVGAKLPGTFEPFNINGSDAGEECCMFCKYGNSPVVMVFAAKPSAAVVELVAKLEKTAASARGPVGACVVVLDTSDAARTELKQLAERQNLKHVVLAVINAGELKRYALHPDAENTVILFNKQVVRVNRAFRAGELTGTATEEIARLTAEHYTAN